MEFRLIHLESQLDTFRTRLGMISLDLFDELLINQVTDLCADLRELVVQMKDKHEEMKCRGVDVRTCLGKYKKSMRDFHLVCHILIHIIEKLEMNDSDFTIDISESLQEHLKQKYDMNRLEMLLEEENIHAIDQILRDLAFRRQCLSSYLETIRSLLQNKPEQNTSFDKYIHKAEKRLVTISDVDSDLNCLRGNLRAIERCIDKYINLLRDGKLRENDHDNFAQYNHIPDIPCFTYIQLMEKLCVGIDKLEIKTTFPTTDQLMKTWQDDHGTDDQFKPKIIELFQAVELDLTELFKEQKSTYSIPYKVGLIGHGSVGKSALAIELANAKQHSAMIDTTRSTFGYLQFDTLAYQHPRTRRPIPFTFVDIEGAIDADESLSAGNYLELITRADCDVYIIVFAGLFSAHNRACRQHIEKFLLRKCLLVRSKADVLFNDIFNEETATDYKKETATDYDVKKALEQTRSLSKVTFDDKRLTDEIYLTAVICKNSSKGASWAHFDLEKLKEKLIHLAIMDIRITRMCQLAILTSKAVINTCFRRGYVISKTRWKWFAAGASLIPFLDELPNFFGREEIRQAFGVHDRSAIKNMFRGTKDSLEEYLTKKNVTLPKNILESGYFEYLESDGPEDKHIYDEASSMYQNTRKSSTVKKNDQWTRHGTKVCTVLTAIGTSVDDILRSVIPAGTVGLRVVSIAGIVVGVALAPVFAVWAAYSSGKRMTEHLHRLCNDLFVIVSLFAVNQCNEHRKKTETLTFSSVFQETSSDEDK
ncbi:unnamed protein product [Adineta steineri]|uniref:Uncharacterized protein n=1 Tax=Adineta steineri TaxID=433720 RepID=A0A815IIN7_9BILA|nr:unnamed protein product [Adineta steineri]CAF1602348.1 unnamed protein product [Adineta steineri]